MRFRRQPPEVAPGIEQMHPRFRGPYSGALKWIGYTPSAKNPNICAR